MNETMALILAFGAGLILGVIFFGGLWWTVQRGVTSRYAALWFPASLALRMGVVVTGFYFVGGHHLARLLLCLAGFILAGMGVTWRTSPAKHKPPVTEPEAGYASHTR